MPTLRIPADQVRIGDLLRFRMSKYDQVKWLKVECITQPNTTKTLTFSGEGWCDSRSIGSKSDWATVKREIASC